MDTSLGDVMPRSVRPVQEPLGLYLRPSRNDHRVLSQLLSEGKAAISGIVFDPEYVDAHEEIRAEIGQRNLEAVLDTRVMELATPTGCPGRRATLPWGSVRPHTLTDFTGAAITRIAEAIAQFVVTKGFTAVLAPTHFLGEGSRDLWFDVDRSLVRALRDSLDSHGATTVAIYYPLALPTRLFFDGPHRLALKSSFNGLRIDGVWPRVHPFGSHSGHLTLHRYIAACRDLHSFPLPLVAERTESIGLPRLAFGAVGGIESGVSSGERFDFSRLTRKRSSNGGFGVPASLRAGAYLDKILRPATDRLGRALQLPLEAATRDKLETERRRLDGWRYTLGEMARTEPGTTQAAVPRRRILRQRRRAEEARI